MSPKRHQMPLSGGDRKALKKQLETSAQREGGLSAKADQLRGRGAAMVRQADRLECEAWNERMWRDGEPIDPSPTIDQAINGGFSYLLVECSRCQAPRKVDLVAVKHAPTTCIHDLASRLICDACKARGRRPRATLKQLAP